MLSLRSINVHKEAKGYQLIFGYLGIFFIVAGVACLLPLLMLFFWPEEGAYAHYFYIPGLSACAVGLLLFFLLVFGRDKAQLGKHQDSVLLVLVWLSTILIGAIPLILRGMNFNDAVFEATSGYSSTGLTVFDFSSGIAPHMYIFFRSVMIFLGGVGLVLVVTSAISDRYGLKLYTAEGHNDKLMPNLVKSARLILGIYAGYILMGTLAFWLIGGMNLFDALNHSTSAVATGGFSSRGGGMYEILTTDFANGVTNELGISVRPLGIEITSTILSILGGTNFLIHMFMWSGKFKKVIKDDEIRFFGIACLIYIPFFFLATFFGNTEGYDWVTSLRYGIFNFVSAITTTGFTNAPNMVVLGNATLMLVILMEVIGGGVGSTSGGVKQFRIVQILKSFYWSVKERLSNKRFVYPHNVYRLGENKEVTSDDANEAYSFFILYLLAMFGFSLILTIYAMATKVELNGHIVTYSDALFEFVNAISGTGMSNGLCSLCNPVINWILVIGMIAGRLEIYPLFFTVLRVNNDIFRKETL